jgi:hypothetical protein
MKKLNRISIKDTKAHKLILFAFYISLFYILLYELIFTYFPSSSDFVFKFGIITSRICYSIIATSIFYFISQYIPVYLPRQKRKIKILYGIFLKTRIIDARVNNLKSELKIYGDDFYIDFDKKVEAIKPDTPVGQFENWYSYLYNLKTQLIDVIRSMTIYNDFLSLEFLEELNLIEYQLLSPYTFVGYQVLLSDDLSYAQIHLQEILVHNKHLQELKKLEFAKYEKIFKTEGEEYRKKYYSNNK